MSPIDRALVAVEVALPRIHHDRAAWRLAADRLEEQEALPRNLAWAEAERLVYGRTSPGWSPRLGDFV